MGPLGLLFYLAPGVGYDPEGASAVHRADPMTERKNEDNSDDVCVV